MSENEPLRGKVWLISELADFEVVRNWETDRFGFPVVECVCPHCGYEFSEEDIKKLAKVEYYDEEVVRLEDVKSAVQGLLEEIENKIKELKKQWKKHLEEDGGSCYCQAYAESCIPERLEDWKLFKKMIRKWFPDVFEEVKENEKN